MHFSFEAVPRSEPWYQTYQRQDEGAEYWHYFSELDTPQPFLLPYEIENFHETLLKSIQRGMHRRRGRGRGGHINLGSRSPRKSPRCHASTLAIMSTIIRRRDPAMTLPRIAEEEAKAKAVAAAATATAASEAAKRERRLPEKPDKSDVDEDLKEIVRNLDDMLSSNDMQEMDSFEVDLLKIADDAVLEPEAPPKGAPDNLLELLDNCHDVPPNGLENSSCASSECGELSAESPLKRRKKRKNKTGWPGNKMRRKLHLKHLNEDLQRELELEKKAEETERKPLDAEALDEALTRSHEDEDNETEHETGKENEQVLNTLGCKSGRSRRIKPRESKEYKEVAQGGSEAKDADEPQGKSVLKSVFGDELSPRKKRAEEDEEPQLVRGARHADGKVSTLSSIGEDSEASLSNNENLCAKDANSLATREKPSHHSKFTRKRQRNGAASSEASHHTEAENRRHSGVGVGSSPRKSAKGAGGESHDLPLERVDASRKGRRKLKQQLHQQRSSERTPTKVVFDDENCKKRTFLSSNERRRLKRVQQRNDGASSELQNGDMDLALSERVSPPLMSSSDVDQRRSSIDYQPVVRVMKIEDQVDRDNSILSVTVASNRRLRSSSSPRSTMQPPNKRFRHGTGRRHLSGQWIKNS